MATIPQYSSFFNPVLKALRELGGSGSLHEVNDKVVQIMGFSKEDLDVLHNPEEDNETEIEYRLAWARTYLKKYGLIDNSSRGVWSLTPKADSLREVDPAEVVRFVRGLLKDGKRKRQRNGQLEEPVSEEDTPEETSKWRVELHKLLTRDLAPDAFERLVQRILRESGFIQVDVTGRTGDGGIDGKGIARIHGLMSFHIVFQCKRYQGVVGASHIRDFRGATVGRADKGLFITTRTFSRDAVREATRDGASPIDLIDGDQLAEKLKDLRLGVKVEMVEKVTVEADWFKSI
jgi:restriction system protein